jgi:hypothetical protein
MRTLTWSAFVATFYVASCSAPPVAAPQAKPSAGDPAITGAGYLLSESEFRAALSVARARLAVLAPSSPIFRVAVITRVKLEAYYCPTSIDRYNFSHTFRQNHPQIGYLLLAKSRGEWHVMPGKEQKLLREENNVIVVMNGSNQAMQPTASPRTASVFND